MLTVVKCGGNALRREPFELGRFVAAGSAALVVHGAGARIAEGLAGAGIASRFVGGRRVTTAEALPIVREAFAAENRELCRQIGPAAVGLMGDELGLEAEPVPELGRVGILRPVAPPLLERLLVDGRVPVVAPLARGPLNVNADDGAAALAQALRADRLVFVSDVAGVVVDGAVVDRLGEEDVAVALHRGQLTGGIVPKLQAALVAARAGIETHVGVTHVFA
jgi:acetylglutamate kinase